MRGREKKEQLCRAVKRGSCDASPARRAEDAGREAENFVEKDIEKNLAAKDTGRGKTQRSGGESVASLPKQSQKRVNIWRPT